MQATVIALPLLGCPLMSITLEPHCTLAEYLARENPAHFKSEFINGEIVARPVCSIRHCEITGNIMWRLHTHSKSTSSFRVYTSDVRVRVPTNGLVAYPDLSLACRPLVMDREDEIAINNPTALVEVYSPDTEHFDRVQKFDLYRQLESLREYILIAQDEAHVERYVRQADDSWLLTVFKGLDAVVELVSLGCSLSLSEVYEDVAFPPPKPPSEQSVS